MSADCNLLFGMLALHTGFISEIALGDSWNIIDCNGNDDILRSLWMKAEPDDIMVVEADLKVIRHGEVPDFAAFVEFRLVNGIKVP